MTALEFEQFAYKWVLLNFSDKCQLKGGYNSTESDIYVPESKTYIDVKYINPSARCGQFTENNINNELLNGSEAVIKEYVEAYYHNKKVQYVFYGNENNFYFDTLHNWINKCHFSLAKPYKKRSGTSKLPQKDRKLFEDNLLFIKEGRTYIKDNTLKNSYIEKGGNTYLINNNSEIRKCSQTKNLTYHIEVKND